MRDVSINHVIGYVISWLEIALKVSKPSMRRFGIKQSLIKKECGEAVRLLEGGQKIVEIEFSAERGGVTQSIVVVVVLSSVLTLMKYDVRNPLFQTVCKSVVQLNIERYGQYAAMVSDPKRSLLKWQSGMRTLGFF